jgi:hypothetical protein
MIKKAIAVFLCAALAVICFASCDGDKEKDAELHKEVIGVWVPMVYDLTTTDAFICVMITEDRHYLYAFGGGEIGNRTTTIEEGTTYQIKNGYFVVNTVPQEEGEKSVQYKALLSFPDRNTMIWGSGADAETYRRMTDDEIAYFGLNLGFYNPDFKINEANPTIVMTGGDTTTGGSGTINFEGAVESSLAPYIEYYATWDYELNPITTKKPKTETEPTE